MNKSFDFFLNFFHFFELFFLAILKYFHACLVTTIIDNIWSTSNIHHIHDIRESSDLSWKLHWFWINLHANFATHIVILWYFTECFGFSVFTRLVVEHRGLYEDSLHYNNEILNFSVNLFPSIYAKNTTRKTRLVYFAAFSSIIFSVCLDCLHLFIYSHPYTASAHKHSANEWIDTCVTYGKTGIWWNSIFKLNCLHMICESDYIQISWAVYVSCASWTIL